MRVAQKGFVIVGVPLLFQVVFVVMLLLLFARLRDDLRQENRARDAVVTAAQLMNSMMDATTAAFVCAGTGESAFIAVFDRDMRKIKGLTERMRVLSADQPEQIPHIDAIARDSCDLENAFRKFLKEPDLIRQALYETGDQKASAVSELTRVAGNDLGLSFGSYISRAEALADKKLKSLDASRRMLFGVLIGGLAADVALTLAISLFIARGIIDRLNIVCGNVESLRLRNPLQTPLTGDDEIAAVDAALHKTAAALREGEKSKAEALSVIQKQLQAPLSDTHAILLDIASQGASLSQKAVGRLGLAIQNLDRLLRLIQDLVQSGSAGKFTLVLQTISLRELLERGALSCETMASRHNVTVSIDSCEETQFQGDSDLLCQILVNLITNAIKFSPAGSTVLVRAGKSETTIEISVIDKGCGIAEGDQEKVFQLFQQVKQTDATEKGGSGLGLAICRSIASEHGGSMGVESSLGQGSRFWIKLPLNPLSKNDSSKPLKIPFKLSIASKVVGLVLGPLLITSLMFIYLTGALTVLEHHITAQVNAKQITAMVSKLGINAVNIVRATVAQKFRGRSDREVFAVEKVGQFARLRQLAKDRPDLMPLVNALESELDKLNSSTDLGVNPAAKETAVSQMVEIKMIPARQFQSSLAATRLIARKIIILSSEADQRNQRAVLNSYNWIFALTLLALLIGALLTILFSVYFSRHITHRLNRLRANAEQLGIAPLPAMAPDAGADEVARLEKFFFDASRTLEELSQFRQNVVAVVSHEMKTPLQTVFGIVVLIPRLTEDSPQHAQIEAGAALAEYHVRRVIRLVHDLLTVEKIHSGTFFLNIQPSSLTDACESAVLLVTDPRAPAPQASVTECQDIRVNIDAERIASVLATIMSNIAAKGGQAKLSASLQGEEEVQFLIQLDHLDAESFNEKLLEQFPDLTSEKFSGITGSIIRAHGGTLTMNESRSSEDLSSISLVLPCGT